MGELNPKNLTLKWEEPVYNRGVYRSIPENFILVKNIIPEIHKHKNRTALLSFASNVIEHLFAKGEPYKIGISFEKDRVIFCFNPKNGVPFYTLAKSGKANVLNNRALVEKIYEYFKLDKFKPRYYLKAHYWAELNSMKLHIVTPQEYNTKLPINDDEMKGEMNLHEK